MRSRFALGIALLVVIAGVAAWVVSRGRPTLETDARRPVESLVVAPTGLHRVARVERPVAPAEGTPRLWEEFKKRFGSELKPIFSGGHLASARGGPGVGTRAAEGFRIDERRRVVARAREIVEAASGLLGLRTEFPLGDPALNQSAVSAQVFFEQTHQGVPLAPRGAVTVDLGTQGELLGLYSDYVPDVTISDEEKITAEQARVRAGIGYREPAEGGRAVYWLLGMGRSARRAYEFIVEGQRVVVDAGTGAVLSRREKRHY